MIGPGVNFKTLDVRHRIMNKITNYLKFWCPPLWIVRMKLRIFAIARFLFERYPLADKSGSLSCQPVFIIGAGRSGTTLLRSMLAAGNQIAIPPESQVIHRLPARFQTWQGLGWTGLVNLVIAEVESHFDFYLWKTNMAPAYIKANNLPRKEKSLARVIDIIFTTYAIEQFPDAKMWGDQSPIHTLFLPNLLAVFPDAKFINLIRDGRDVVSSYVKMHGDSILGESIYRWRESILRVKKVQKRIAGENFLDLKYEDLVLEPESALRKVSGFLGIEYSESMLDYWKLDTTVESKVYGHHQNLQKPVFTSSIGAWKTRLSEEQQRITINELSTLLSELGYE